MTEFDAECTDEVEASIDDAAVSVLAEADVFLLISAPLYAGLGRGRGFGSEGLELSPLSGSCCGAKEGSIMVDLAAVRFRVKDEMSVWAAEPVVCKLVKSAVCIVESAIFQ